VGKASVVFLAIRREHYSVLWDLKHLLAGKVCVFVCVCVRGLGCEQKDTFSFFFF
jgi:hypothetical protein